MDFSMASPLLALVGAYLLYYFGSIFNGYRKNIANAKASGFTYVILPWFPYNVFWMIYQHKLIPIIRRVLPERWTGTSLSLLDTDWIWNSLREPFDELNTEAILLVTSNHNILFLNDASAIHQITSSRERFPKPTEDYSVLNTFGRNIVTTEGPEWRRHRKAMAPGFNEPNNRLVFHETIMQADAMIRHWMRGSDGGMSKVIRSLPDDTMRITLHIITAIGFGVRLLWPGETAMEKGESGLITFPDEPEDGHTMSFQASIKLVLEESFLIVLLPMKVLQYGTHRMRQAYESYINWKAYTEELLDKKAQQTRAGEKVEGMDLMRLLVENTSDPAILAQTSPGKVEAGKRGTDLTKSEILGDTFITVLAGHETTANTIHFMLVHLALSPSSQRHLQADVDKTFSSTPENPTPPSEWDYDTCITTLLGNMVGATFNEMLRLMPPVMAVPKKVADGMDQTITIDGQTNIIHSRTRINLNNVGVQRSPKYWPSTGPSKISGKGDDLDDFVPERWLKGGNGEGKNGGGGLEMQEVDKEFGGFTGTDTSSLLFKPVPGSYVPFSDGQRSCLGRRLAQVEMVTVMSVIFQKYNVELAVDEWASDDDVGKMDAGQRKELYRKAMDKARRAVRSASTMLTLKLHGVNGGDKYIPVRIVKRGEERFLNLFE